MAAPERDPQPARGEEWVLPPQPRRTPRTPATRFTSQRADCAAATRGSVSSFSAKKDETDPLSEEQRQRKVQKGREALQRFCATKDAKDRGAPGVAAHRFRATFEGRDNITGRFMAPLKTPSRYVPPRRAMRRLGASALLQALPRAQSLALRRRKF